MGSRREGLLNTFNWPNLFARAGRSILIANFKPNHSTARNVYAEDRALIHAAADVNGFKVLHGGPHVCFIRGKELK